MCHWRSYLSLLHSSVDVFILLELLQFCLNQHLSDVHHLLHSQRQTLHRETELLLQQDTHLWTDRQYSKRLLKQQVQHPGLHYSVYRQSSLYIFQSRFWISESCKCLMTALLWCTYSCTEQKIALIDPLPQHKCLSRLEAPQSVENGERRTECTVYSLMLSHTCNLLQIENSSNKINAWHTMAYFL